MKGPRWFKAEEKNCPNGKSPTITYDKPYMTTLWDIDELFGEYIVNDAGREIYILVIGDVSCAHLRSGKWTECDGEGNEL